MEEGLDVWEVNLRQHFATIARACHKSIALQQKQLDSLIYKLDCYYSLFRIGIMAYLRAPCFDASAQVCLWAPQYKCSKYELNLQNVTLE